jgi:hypothetical protein
MLLSRVANHSDQAIKDMGYNARKFVETDFSVKRYFDEMSALYNLLMQKKFN